MVSVVAVGVEVVCNGNVVLVIAVASLLIGVVVFGVVVVFVFADGVGVVVVFVFTGDAVTGTDAVVADGVVVCVLAGGVSGGVLDV